MHDLSQNVSQITPIYPSFALYLKATIIHNHCVTVWISIIPKDMIIRHTLGELHYIGMISMVIHHHSITIVSQAALRRGIWISMLNWMHYCGFPIWGLHEAGFGCFLTPNQAKTGHFQGRNYGFASFVVIHFLETHLFRFAYYGWVVFFAQQRLTLRSISLLLCSWRMPLAARESCNWIHWFDWHEVSIFFKTW